MWRLQNDFAGKDSAQAEEGASDEDMADEPSFTEITLDVRSPERIELASRRRSSGSRRPARCTSPNS